MKVSSPQLVRMYLGIDFDFFFFFFFFFFSPRKMSRCNVEQLKNIPELETWDNEQNYVKNSPGLKLYHKNCKASLPDAEADLKFYLCSLAPPVEKTVSPAHIALTKAFEQTASHEIASCAKVKLSLHVATGLVPRQKVI